MLYGKVRLKEPGWTRTLASDQAFLLTLARRIPATAMAGRQPSFCNCVFRVSAILLYIVGQPFLENFLKFNFCAFGAFLRPYKT